MGAVMTILSIAALVVVVIYGVGLVDDTWADRRRARDQKKREIEEARQRELIRFEKFGEPFSAYTSCPKCQSIDLHWINTYIKSGFDSFFMLTVSNWLNKPMAVDTKVEVNCQRQCRRCGFTWKQY